MPSSVVFVAAECEPWAKTGGLADVVDALARALGQAGGSAIEPPVEVFLPRYRDIAVPEGRELGRRSLRIADPASGPRATTTVAVVDVEADGYRLRLVDHPASFDRAGGYYGDAAGDYPDNARRFGVLARAAIGVRAAERRPIDLLHLHDWHAVPAIRLSWAQAARTGSARPATLLTVHNLAYHGYVAPDHVVELGPAWRARRPVVGPAAEGVDLLAAGIAEADLVNTVSPGFAAESVQPGRGHGLDGILRARGDRFLGILNGLDTHLWDPATDGALAARYDRANRAGKAACRQDLLRAVGLDPTDPAPVLGMIGRLDPQKGFDLLAAAAPTLTDEGIRLVVEGSGSSELVAPLARLAADRPRSVAIIERFDREMARRIYAGVDGFLMPSRFEPCGTGQMIAMRYGTPPIVHATGGLADTVVDEHDHPGEGTGFAFRHPTADGLIWATREFAVRHRTGGPAWEGIVDRAMATDFDWRRNAVPAYLEAYRRARAIADGGRSGT